MSLWYLIKAASLSNVSCMPPECQWKPHWNVSSNLYLCETVMWLCCRSLKMVTSFLLNVSWLHYFRHRTIVESLIMQVAWCQWMSHWCVPSRWLVTFASVKLASYSFWLAFVRTICRASPSSVCLLQTFVLVNL